MRNVLITGATGGFGRAFVKFLLANNRVERVCVYSRGEHMQAELRYETHADDRVRYFIGDVRDEWRLDRAFEGVDTVVHAAALKRIEVGHYNPDELVKTNVFGAMNVIGAARRQGVKTVLALSTDKACEPISAYGQSKALMESLFLAANHNQGPRAPRFGVTRYGNVAGSPGSVIPKWRKLIAEDKAVPITNPECTRFWMTMEEAVFFVIDAIRLLEQPTYQVKHVLTPELPAYRLGDLAVAMGAKHTEHFSLPSFEKTHESMRSGETSDKARRMSVGELREALKHV